MAFQAVAHVVIRRHLEAVPLGGKPLDVPRGCIQVPPQPRYDVQTLHLRQQAGADFMRQRGSGVHATKVTMKVRHTPPTQLVDMQEHGIASSNKVAQHLAATL